MLEFGGALSGEHGDGLVRSPFMREDVRPGALRGVPRHQADLRSARHPQSGKIVDAPPLTVEPALRRRLRDADSRRRSSTTREYGGMGGAVEMCSGLGACRKKLDGTMCPSYMATREEAHSTRGRANVLRLAMAGRLGEAGLGDEGVRRGARSVPRMPRLQGRVPGRRRHGALQERVPRRLLAAARRAAPGARARAHRTSCRAGAAASRRCRTAVARSAPARWMNERLLGIDRRRALPALDRRTRSRAGSRGGTPSAGDRDALLFNDTFTNYYDPEIGVAGARRARSAPACASALAPNGCCGRPLISQGLLGRGAALRRRQRRRALSAARRAARAIVFFEPSCLSAVREDAPALLRGEAQQKARAGRRRVRAVRGIRRAAVRGGQAAAARQGPPTILLHGHCHQKSMGLLAPAQALLSRIPGATVVDLDAGCCGMAGSFGYAREHFDVSRQIGERRLLPAVRALTPASVLVAAGTSCRHQVARLRRRPGALHPAELLRSLLTESRMNLAVPLRSPRSSSPSSSAA